MWSYYAFMALLTVTLILWAIIALRDDSQDREEPRDTKPDPPGKTSNKSAP